MIRKWKTSLRFELIPKCDVFGFRQHYYVCLPLENLSFNAFCWRVSYFTVPPFLRAPVPPEEHVYIDSFHFKLRPPQQHPKVIKAVSTNPSVEPLAGCVSFGKKIQAQGAEVEANPSKVCNGRFLGSQAGKRTLQTCVGCRNHHLSYTHHGLFAVEDDFFLVNSWSYRFWIDCWFFQDFFELHIWCTFSSDRTGQYLWQ